MNEFPEGYVKVSSWELFICTFMIVAILLQFLKNV